MLSKRIDKQIWCWSFLQSFADDITIYCSIPSDEICESRDSEKKYQFEKSHFLILPISRSILYREEVVQIALWQKAWENKYYLNHGKSQRVYPILKLKYAGKPVSRIKNHKVFRQVYFQSKLWYFVQVLNRLTSLRSAFIGKSMPSFISIPFNSRQWLKLNVFDNWKNRRHRENRLLLLRIWLLIFLRDWSPWYSNSL